jgi:hypothetical protein
VEVDGPAIARSLNVVLKENSVGATRERSRVALITCAQLAELEPDDQLVVPALRERGIEGVPVVWDAPDVDWAGFALAVLRSPWDYVRRREEFVAWAAKVPRLANPADVITWNTDKRYLRELAVAGVPVVPTTWVEPGDEWRRRPPALRAGRPHPRPGRPAGTRRAGAHRAVALLRHGRGRRGAVRGGGRLAPLTYWAYSSPSMSVSVEVT